MGKEKNPIRQKSRPVKKNREKDYSQGMWGGIAISGVSVLGSAIGLWSLGSGTRMGLLVAVAISFLILLWKRSCLSSLRFVSVSGDVFLLKWAGYLLAAVATVGLTTYGGYCLFSPRDIPVKKMQWQPPVRQEQQLPEYRWEEDFRHIQEYLDDVKKQIGVREEADPLSFAHQYESSRFLNHLEFHLSVLSSQQIPQPVMDSARAATASIADGEGGMDSEKAVQRLRRYLEVWKEYEIGESVNSETVGGRTDSLNAAERALQGLEEHLKALHAHFKLPATESTVSVVGRNYLMPAGTLLPASGEFPRSVESVPGNGTFSAILLPAPGLGEFLDAAAQWDWRIILFSIFSSLVEIFLFLKVQQRQRIDGFAIGKK